jgi:hypothetical protein
MRGILVLALLLWAAPAAAATDVWIFYGAGFHFWSSGMDEIARRAVHLRGVGAVHGPYDYRETQRAYDEIMAAPHEHSIVISGYSCGGNAAGAVAQGLARTGRHVHLAVIQPSIWCGNDYMRTTSNVGLAQDTFGDCLQTLGLGCAQFSGDAHRIILINRPDLHLEADTDVNAQRDVLGAIYTVANPSRGGLHVRHLYRTTRMTLYAGQNVWRLHER